MSFVYEEDFCGVYIDVQGTKPEAMAKWLGTGEAGLVKVHLCTPECNQEMCGDNYAHAKSVRVIDAGTDQAWHSNVVGLAPVEPEDAAGGLRLALDKVAEKEGQGQAEEKPAKHRAVKSSVHRSALRGTASHCRRGPRSMGLPCLRRPSLNHQRLPEGRRNYLQAETAQESHALSLLLTRHKSMMYIQYLM